jgi:hypothetical protein
MTIVGVWTFVSTKLEVTIPLFSYFVTWCMSMLVRSDSGTYFVTRDLPGMGAEFCKIGSALLLGALALGPQSDVLRGSVLQTNVANPNLAMALLLVVTVLCTGISWKVCLPIEGKRPWRREIGNWNWFLRVMAGQTLGLVPLCIAAAILERS